MSKFASGVCLVLYKDTGTQATKGITISSFCSLSLDPPMVLFCLKESAATYPALSQAAGYSIHILSTDHQELATACTQRHGSIVPSHLLIENEGQTLLSNAIVSLQCQRQNILIGGDHGIFLSIVKKIVVNDQQLPLLYYNRKYDELSTS